MIRTHSGPRAAIVAAGMVAILAAGCGGTATSAAPSAAAPAATPAAVATQAPAPTPEIVMVTPEPIATATGPNGGKVLRWFIGLGGGGKPEQIAAEQKFAADFNASQKDIYLTPEIYDNSVAAQQLQVQIAAGNPPDIIGPVGVEGLNIFRDNLLDVQPLIESQNFDMSAFDPALKDFFAIGKGGATIGVPYANYPSFIYYNKKLFDEAKLPYPPTKVGDMYMGKPWDMAAVRELGMKLTVDKNGNDATSADFDPENIVQWGFDMQWADDRSDTEATIFGSSSVVTPDGKTAQITPQFAEGMKWFNDGVWKDHFIPTKAADPERPAGQGQPVPVRQPRDGRYPPLVHLLHQPRRAGQAQLRLGRRGHAVEQRRHDGQAARRHVQHPELDQEPGGGLQGRHRPGRIARAAHQLRWPVG